MVTCEFPNQATSMMSSGQTVVIRHGQPIGVDVPVTATDRKAAR